MGYLEVKYDSCGKKYKYQHIKNTLLNSSKTKR